MIDVPVRVKDALRDGRRLKEYRFNVLNDDDTTDFTIDNDYLVSETVKFDERMCSDETIKFGLCEGTSLEFQYFNKDNINGRRIQAFVDVQYEDANGDLQWYTIPMGFYTVKQCPMQFSTGIRKVTAYNKLMSDYLDQKANSILSDAYGSDYTIYVYDILNTLLGTYTITPDRTAQEWEVPPLTWIPSYTTDLGTFNLTSQYGIPGPFNYYILRNTSGGTVDFHIYVYADVIEYNSYEFTDSYFQIDARYGNLTALENNVVSFIKNMIDTSELDRTGEQVIDYICANDNFVHVFGILLGSDKYSTVQWEYEEANGLTHTVAGTLLDAQRMMDNATITSLVNVSMVIPSLFLVDRQFIVEWSFTGVFYPTLTSHQSYYEYYTDSSMTDTTQVEMPYMIYSDGTKWTGYDTRYAIQIYIVNPSDAELVQMQISSIPDFTLRDLQTAVFELNCQYGKLDRETDLFAGVSLGGSHLYPADDLYPADSLYPDGTSEHGLASSYSKLWTDSGGTQSFRYLIITYKTTDGNGNEVDATLQRTVNADGTTDYNMSDNWLFRNLVWTSSDVGDYADAMVTLMQGVEWFPFEMWAAGLPYLETGDEIEITNSEGTYTSYILQRQLQGIQNLQDTFINGTLDIF